MHNLVSNRLDRIWRKFQRKSFREGFIESHLTSNIAAQVATLRQDRNWTQTHLAKLAKMRQSQISELENPSFSGLTLKTLAKIASAFDVAVVIRFVRFSEVAEYTTDETPGKHSVPSFKDDRQPTNKLVTTNYDLLLSLTLPPQVAQRPDPTHNLIEYPRANLSRELAGTVAGARSLGSQMPARSSPYDHMEVFFESNPQERSAAA